MKSELRTILLGLYFIIVGGIALILDGVQWLIDMWGKVRKRGKCPYNHQIYKDMGMTYCPHCLKKFNRVWR